MLAGTAEGGARAARLAEDSRIDATASLAGATRSPAPYAGRVRVGGFGGASGFAGYLQDERIAAVIDATHPFARVMPRRAQAT